MLFPPETKHYVMPEPSQDPRAAGKSIILIHHLLAPDAMAFLEKMIGAFGWSPEQCYHLQFESDKMENPGLLWRSADLKLVISFGISPEWIGLYISSRLYQLIDMGSFMIYSCDTLEQLATNKDLKGKIWKDLKNISLEQA